MNPCPSAFSAEPARTRTHRVRLRQQHAVAGAASNSTTAPATDTFKDAIAPAMGIRSRWSQVRRTRSCSPRAFAPQHQRAWRGEVKLVVVRSAALVKADNPDICRLDLFKRPRHVYDPRHAHVLRSAGRGFGGYAAQRRSPSLG